MVKLKAEGMFNVQASLKKNGKESDASMTILFAAKSN